MRVFAGKSFFTATVAEIAREAGVADGTIYLYFKSKDDLLICLFEEKMAELNTALEAELRRHERPLEQLRAFLRLHLQLVATDPDLAEVLTVELRQSAKLMKEYEAKRFGAYLELLGGILERGVADGSLRAGLDVRTVRRAIFGALDETALSWLLGGRRFDLAHAADELAELFCRGLSAEPTRPKTKTKAGRAS